MAKASGVVALLTDYGLRDSYVGILKGAILSVAPEARIVDLTHEIPPQDIREASRVLAAAVPYFPAGTIFVSVVDPGVGSDRAVAGVEWGGHLFLAPDNGLLGILARPDRMVHVTASKYFRHPVSDTFHGRDIFAPVAGHLVRGVDLGRFGPPLKSLQESDLPALRPAAGRGVQGEVVAIDRFGNVITNIPGEAISDGPGLRITVGRRTLRKLSRTYADVRKGDLLALVGSTGHLEISVNQGSAQKAARIRRGDRVVVTPTRR